GPRPDGQRAGHPAPARDRGGKARREPAPGSRLGSRSQGRRRGDPGGGVTMAAPQAPWIGKKQGKLTLDEAVFGERFHGPLVHEAARAEMNARRRGTASTKSRG